MSAAIQKRIDRELAKPSYSPEAVPNSPLVKASLELDDASRMAVILSLRERIAAQRKKETTQALSWHAHEIARHAFGRSKMSWPTKAIERLAAIAAGMVEYYSCRCRRS